MKGSRYARALERIYVIGIGLYHRIGLR